MTSRNLQPPSGHRTIDHTADVAVELWAPTEPELLREAARAVADILTGGAPGATRTGSGETRTIRLDATDAEDRLVQWMNEVIFFAVSEGFLYRDADLDVPPDPAAPGGVEGNVRGEALREGALATELKSATYHDLRVERDARGALRALVVVDV